MSDYIRRQDVMDLWNKYRFTIAVDAIEYDMRLKRLPSADVVQVVHARWENYSPITIKCSRCGHVIQDWRYSECKYCPNCGARMDGERKE